MRGYFLTMTNSIRFDNGIIVYVVYEEPITENSPARIVIPKSAKFDDKSVLTAMECVMTDPQLSPYNEEFAEAIENSICDSYDDEDEKLFEKEGIPKNIKELFETKEINPNGFKDISEFIDPKEKITLYAVDSEDPHYWFGELNLSDQKTSRYILNNQVGYLLTKFVLKDKSILLRLLVSPVFELKQFEDGTYGIYVSDSENSIEFKPYKIKRSKKC